MSEVSRSDRSKPSDMSHHQHVSTAVLSSVPSPLFSLAFSMPMRRRYDVQVRTRHRIRLNWTHYSSALCWSMSDSIAISLPLRRSLHNQGMTSRFRSSRKLPIAVRLQAHLRRMWTYYVMVRKGPSRRLPLDQSIKSEMLLLLTPYGMSANDNRLMYRDRCWNRDAGSSASILSSW